MNDQMHLDEGRLGEGPIPNDDLWRIYWGTENSVSAILARLGRTLCGERMSSVLVCGRYGTGKTSFLRALWTYLEKSTPEPTPLQLWLHMPLITSNPNVPADVAVIGAIIENLCGTPLGRPDEWSAKNRIRSDFDTRLLNDALNDLWRAAYGNPAANAFDAPCEVPRRNGMAGAAGTSARSYRTNTIEQYIDHFLNWDIGQARSNGQDTGTRLIVYLDDVDRCHQHVPAAIIRLLLRFSNSRAVRFVIACDRDLMQKGAEDWMQLNGTGLDGHTYVTANSALEKYLTLMVEIPALSEHPEPDRPDVPASMSLPGPLVEHFDKPRKGVGEGRGEPILRRWSGGNRSPILAEFLLTWLLADIKETDLVLSPEADLVWDEGSPHTSAPATEPYEPTPQSTPRKPSATMDHSGDPTDLSDSKLTDQKDIQESSKDTTPTKAILSKILTDFSRSLRGMVDLDTASGLLRLRDPYHGLAGSLTPRQLKFYLRARLWGTSPSDFRPAETLLKQLFPVFSRISQDEPEIFAFIISLAKTSLERGRDGSRQLALFYGQLQALTATSTLLTPERLKQAWPGQHDERVLLLRLLSAIHWERHPASETNASSGYPSSQADADTFQLGHPSVSAVSPLAISGPDQEFADWVRSWLRVAPKGATVAAQVSSFEDMAVAAYRQGNPDAVQYVGEYATHFLERHKPFFQQETAISLSNLAVTINDAPGSEAQSDRLFDAAVTLNPKHVRIALFYADFLLAVALAPTRLPRLVPQPYPDIVRLLDRADRLIDQILHDADETSSFYANLLRLRLDFKRREVQEPDNKQSDDSIDKELRKLVSDNVVFLLTSCYNGEQEPFSRLDQTLDMLVGSNDTALPRKAHIFGLPWGVADASGLKIPTWPMATQIANNYVGQSRDNSPSEKLGLRINLSLLQDAPPLEPRRTAAIWTQTLLAWARRPGTKSSILRSRAALGLLAALEYGQGENWERRADRVWGDLGGKAPASPQTLIQSLNADHKVLHQRLQNNLNDPDLLQQVVTAVFQQDLGEPISTLAALAEAENWKDWPAFHQEVARMAADHRNELEKLSQ